MVHSERRFDMTELLVRDGDGFDLGWPSKFRAIQITCG